MDSLIAHFQRMALYNRRANEILYDACARLNATERKKERKAFFTSIHGTLNHILLGDRIWLGRFEGSAMPSTGLDAILCEDFEELRAARRSEDDRLDHFTAKLTPSVLEGSIDYINNAGHRYQDPMSVLIAHLFNHQTHHRGQVHDMLSQTDVPPPSLDMHRVLLPAPVA